MLRLLCLLPAALAFRGNLPLHSDGEHHPADDGAIASKILSNKYRWWGANELGNLTAGCITVEDAMHTILDAKIHPVDVSFEDICVPPMNPSNLHDLDRICGSKLGELDHMTRGRAQLPSIIVETKRNPCGRRYTMMDGMHRICRLKRAGAARGCFYVLSEDQAYEATTKLDPVEARKRTGWSAHPRSKRPLLRYEAMDLVWHLALDFFQRDMTTCLPKPGYLTPKEPDLPPKERSRRSPRTFVPPSQRPHRGTPVG
mmetsp:Transcript_11597/g.34536  ORF Transcript_11597/g.34536 Transcript_11597/m.34536 type:complete len:257 (+) Transcript_11597:163-933(+)